MPRLALIMFIFPLRCAGPTSALTDDDVLDVLRANRDDITECREEARKQDGRRGMLKVYLEIPSTGFPKHVEVTDPRWRGSAAERCLVERITKWRFPSFEGKSIPIDFPVRI